MVVLNSIYCNIYIYMWYFNGILMIYPRVKTAGVYVNLLEGKIFFPKSMVVKMVEQDGEI